MKIMQIWLMRWIISNNYLWFLVRLSHRLAQNRLKLPDLYLNLLKHLLSWIRNVGDECYILSTKASSIQALDSKGYIDVGDWCRGPFKFATRCWRPTFYTEKVTKIILYSDNVLIKCFFLFWRPQRFSWRLSPTDVNNFTLNFVNGLPHLNWRKING